MMDYKIGIASYNRAAKQRTIEYLAKIGFQKEQIILSLQTEKDFREYEKYRPFVGEYVFADADSAGKNRNNILRRMGAGERIVLIDDDISYISKKKDGTLIKIETKAQFDEMVYSGFKAAEEYHTIGFGLYPVHNLMFMKETISTRKIVDAGLMGLITGEFQFDETLELKEDYDLCCRAIMKYGSFIRLDNYSAQSPAGHKGGCESAWDDMELRIRTAELLVKRYPTLLKLNSKKGGEVLMKKEISESYGSPRWSGELADCSLPVTMDTYSNCSFGCVYCFSQYQRGLGKSKEDYLTKQVKCVNVDRVKAIFDGSNEKSVFHDYVKDRRPIQWGGLSDQFDGFEKLYGKTYEILKYMKELNYPICFSTKATWVFFNEKYRELFRGQDNWNMKFSIITLDEDDAAKIEVGVPSPKERLRAMHEYTTLNNGGATLRLRPFIPGVSDKTYKDLIIAAHDAGATAVTTEFFCLEMRSINIAKEHYKVLSECAGFDIVEFYRRYSNGTGYLRLNRKIKEKYIKEMKSLCDKLGMRFYVSDAHFKEACENSCCCALNKDWEYSKGNFSYALEIAKKRGFVKWSDIEWDMYFLEKTKFVGAEGFNTNSSETRAKFSGMNLKDYLHYLWNMPNQGQSPYKIFERVLMPDGRDDNGNIIYKYNDDVTFRKVDGTDGKRKEPAEGGA